MIFQQQRHDSMSNHFKSWQIYQKRLITARTFIIFLNGGVHPSVEQGDQRIVLEVPAQTVEQRRVLAQHLTYEIEFALQGKLARITEGLGHGSRIIQRGLARAHLRHSHAYVQPGLHLVGAAKKEKDAEEAKVKKAEAKLKAKRKKAKQASKKDEV